MIEFYPQVRSVHIGAVIVSGVLFALRGAGVTGGARWPLAAPLRYLSYSVDTTLLTAALMLVAMLRGATYTFWTFGEGGIELRRAARIDDHDRDAQIALETSRIGGVEDPRARVRQYAEAAHRRQQLLQKLQPLRDEFDAP